MVVISYFFYKLFLIDFDPVHTIRVVFENGRKFLRLEVAFTRCRYEKMWNCNANRKSLKTICKPYEFENGTKFYCQSAVWKPNRKNFITVMQNEITKTSKVVVGYFILSILTDLCSILSKRNIICRCEGRIPCRYRVNGVFIVSSVYTYAPKSYAPKKS
jgi:hypothetical protein